MLSTLRVTVDMLPEMLALESIIISMVACLSWSIIGWNIFYVLLIDPTQSIKSPLLFTNYVSFYCRPISYWTPCSCVARLFRCVNHTVVWICLLDQVSSKMKES